MKVVFGLLVAVMAAGFAGPAAQAADVWNPKTYAAARHTGDAYNWTGFYVGVNGGYTDGRDRFSDSAGSVNTNPTNLKGGTFGGQMGYNWQLGVFVLGGEMDLNYSAAKFNETIDLCPGCGPGYSQTNSASMPWSGTARGRIGFTPLDRWLVYGTAGVAYGRVRLSSEATYGGFGSSAWSSEQNVLGLVVGGGIEYAFYDRWSIKGEYLRRDMDLRRDSSSSTNPWGSSNYASTTGFVDNIFRLGVNYRF